MATTRRLARGGAVLTAAGLLTLGLGTAPAFADGPTTGVTPTTGLNPDGQEVTIHGSGFNPTANNGFGIYVAFGPKGDDYATNAGAYGATKWVHTGATPSATQDVMNSDGTFDTTLNVQATYTDGSGEEVNCLTTQCYIVTIAAHGVPDRSQDTFTPLTFVGGENPGDPGGGDGGQDPSAGRQTLTTTVGNGALTLSLAGDTAQLSSVAPGRHSTGSLQTATVTDARGTQAGWSLVGEVTDEAALTRGWDELQTNFARHAPNMVLDGCGSKRWASAASS